MSDPTSMENVTNVLGRWSLGEGLPERAKRDGCGCPPWVRCVHFEGKVLQLSSLALVPTDLPHLKCLSLGLFVPLFQVRFGADATVACGTCGLLCCPLSRSLHEGDIESDALAAFHTEEARLLAREVLP